MTGQKKGILIFGIILLAAGLGLYVYSVESRFPGGFPGFGFGGNGVDNPHRIEIKNRLREADEYLRQNSDNAAGQAQKIFTRLYSRDDTPADLKQLARYGLAVSLEKQGDRASALEHYRALKKARPTDSELVDKVDFSLGRMLMYINHETEGRALLDSLLSRTNDSRMKSKIHTAFGDYYLRRGRTEKARENYLIALKYNADNLRAEIGRANASRSLGKTASAYDYYDDFLLGNANLTPEKRRRLKQRLSNEYYDLALRHYRSGSYWQAAHYFRRTLNSSAGANVKEKALYWLAESYYSLGQKSQAYNTFSRVLRNADSTMDQPALIKKGIILFQRNKMKSAAAYFKKAEEDYGNTHYTRRAREWREEAEAQIRENSEFKIQSEDEELGE